jgi:hypothetical protein
VTQQEFIEKYGEVEVKFHSYYKYSFMFKGVTDDGDTIFVSVGGDSDYIYRLEVGANTIETVGNLCPFQGHVFNSTSEVDSFYEY